MHWLEQHHKVSLSTVAPVIGVFNMFLVATLVNEFNMFANINNHHNPALIGLIYFVSFMAPHIFMRNEK